MISATCTVAMVVFVSNSSIEPNLAHCTLLVRGDVAWQSGSAMIWAGESELLAAGIIPKHIFHIKLRVRVRTSAPAGNQNSAIRLA